MKKKKQRKPRQSQPKSKLSVLRQVCDLIPSHLVGKLARKHGVDKKARKITPWSHVVSMVFAQISGAISLNDVCDNLRNHGGLLATIRAALAPPVATASPTPTKCAAAPWPRNCSGAR
jgi:hypothetical protein